MKVFGSKARGTRLERIQSSPRYVNGTFQNTPVPGPGEEGAAMLPMLAEYLFGGDRRVPSAPLPMVNPLDGWRRPPDTGLRATWLGHSTVLLEIDGTRVLTDPVWGQRVSPLSFAGPKRFHPAPVEIEQLPALDAILVSHDHYDHLDYPSIQRLLSTGAPFVTSLGVGAHLEAWGVPTERIFELDWWESVQLGDLSITAAPSRHFSGRGLVSRNRTLWSSLVVRGPRHSVFFSGDTGLTPEYAEIRERLGAFDLVMLEVGAWHPGFSHIHLGAENALRAHALLGGGALLPVHWGTFNLAIHSWDEPAETLVKAASAGAPLVMPRLGQPIEPARVESVDAWWREVEQTAIAAPVPTAAFTQAID
ncbi:MBL fold metallo-hydrolase [Hyalangium rubrum]|uniref:MBL fold metallo-hydrolase n=1 Tax=Hyalangium rubrum TaxID=3103134 RepID=A0ABU5GWZ0_9BACT|nr:MBL fold metallo-hydrolase [Hyalangium sp. s54d21]MDY7225711.1 MBL fold metallo-hydrolase [Hyalangium sp. s54d21]